MTQLDLTTLPPRIRAHKESLIHIVQPPVCTERARHYTEAYQAHLARLLPVRRALALAHHLKERTIWIKHDELIVGNQASQVRAAPLFPEYTVGWIEKEIDELADRPGAGFAVSEADKLAIHALTPSGAARRCRIAATASLPTSRRGCWRAASSRPRAT